MAHLKAGDMETIQKSIIVYCILSFLIFAGACLGVISPLSLLVMLCISLAMVYPLRRLAFDQDDWPALAGGQRRAVMISVAAVMILFVHVMILPIYARDDIIYHLLVPKQLLGSGGFVFDPYNINSNFPMLFEMPLTLFLLTDGWIAPFLVNCLVLLCLCVTYYFTATRLFQVKHTLSLGAVLLLATTPVIYDQVRSCYVELFMALLLMVAFYNYCLFRTHRDQPRYWYLAMLFTGLLCATKYTGGVYALFILGVEFFASRNRPQFYKGFLVCVLVGLPWYLKNWIILGNPVFPLLPFLFPSEFVTVERSIFYRHLFADYHAGRGWLDYLLLPLRLLVGYDPAPEPGQLGFGGKLSLYFICAYTSVAAFFKVAGSSPLAGHRRVVGVLFACYALFWAITSQQVRFFLPVLILASLAGLSMISAHWRRARWGLITLGGIILIQNAANIGSTINAEKIDDLITGRITREQFLDLHLPISHRMANNLNRMLDSRHHKILTIGTFGRNYYFDIETVTNTYYEAEVLARAFHTEKAQPRLLDDFIRTQGITHLLINHSYLDQFFSQNAAFDSDGLKQYLRQKPIILRQKAVVVYGLSP